MNNLSSRNNYFSIPDILASQERVHCTFTRNVSYLGMLDPCSQNSTILQGSSPEIPFWIVKALFDEDVISIDLPKAYKPGFADILRADASVVNLHKSAKFFYEFGRLLSFLDMSREVPDIMPTLVQAFIDRYRQISDWAQNLGDSAADHGMAERLDNLEKEIMCRGRKAQNQLTFWLSHGSGHIHVADLVSRYKKRKVIDSSTVTVATGSTNNNL